jgi:hypothetical protein
MIKRSLIEASKLANVKLIDFLFELIVTVILCNYLMSERNSAKNSEKCESRKNLVYDIDASTVEAFLYRLMKRNQLFDFENDLFFE